MVTVKLTNPNKPSRGGGGSSNKKDIYVPIEDVSPSGEGARVYERAGEDFKRVGTVVGGGVRRDITDTKAPTPEITQKPDIRNLDEIRRRETEQQRSERLLRSLRVREELRRELERKGRSLSSRDIRKELRLRGTSTEELREATKTARVQIRRGGENVFVGIEKEKKQPKIKEIKRTRNIIFSPNKIISSESMFISKDPFGQGTAVLETITLEEEKKRISARLKGNLFSVPIKDIQQRKAEEFGFGLGKDKVKLKSSRVDTRTKSELFFSSVGERLKDTLGDKFSSEQKKVIVREPVFGTIQTDPTTQKQILFKEKELATRSPRQAARGTIGLGSELLFFTPRFTGAITEEGFKGGRQGAVGFDKERKPAGIKGFFVGVGGAAVERPIESVAILTAGASQLIKPASRLLTPITKRFKGGFTTVGKATAIPEEKFISLQAETKTFMNKERILGREIRSSAKVDDISISIKEKPKGKTFFKEEKLTGDFIGTVEEVYKKGKIKTKTNLATGEISLIDTSVSRTGIARLTKEGKYIEEVSLGKGFFGDAKKRIITLEKDGKGTLEIFKGERLVSKKLIKSKSKATDQLKTKKGINKIKVDEQFSYGGKKEIIEYKDFGKRKQKIVIGEKGKTGSTAIKADISIETAEASNVFTGEFFKSEVSGGYLDVIKSEPIKGQIKSGTKSVGIKYQVSKNPLLIEDTSKALSQTDTVFRTVKGEKENVLKRILPKTEREITKVVEQRVVFGYVNPEGRFIRKKIEYLEKFGRKNKQIANVRVEKIAKRAKEIKEQGITNFKELKTLGLKRENKGIRKGVELIDKTPESIYQGKGLQIDNRVYFETATQLSRPLPSPDITIPSIKYSVVKEPTVTIVKPSFSTGVVGDKDKIIVETKPEIKMIEKTKTETKLLLKEKPLLALKSFQDLSQGGKMIERIKTKQDMTSKTKTIAKQGTPQKTSQITQLRRITVPRTTTIQRPIIIPIKTPKTFPSIENTLPRLKKESLFKIFARVKGKDIKLGTARTESEAFGKLFSKLGSTLRASGFVETSKGKKVSLGLLPRGFRRSKRDAFRIVEKKGRRLRKGTTGKQIQPFRKKKGVNLFGL